MATATARQLSYWDKTKLVSPQIKHASGSGSRRLYSLQDVIELRIVMSLLKAGVSLQHIRESLAFIKNMAVPLVELIILTDGKNVYFTQEAGMLINAAHSGQMVSQIIVGDLAREILLKAEASPALIQ